MKIIKFNELKSDVYFNAAKKLKELGHLNKAKRLEEHPIFLSKLKYKNIEPFSFRTVKFQNLNPKVIISPNIDYKGKIIGINPGMMHDLYNDSDKENLVIYPMFEMYNDKGKDSFIPFIIDADCGDNFNLKFFMVNKIEICNVFDYDNTIFEDDIPSNSTIFFSNPKDARRFINFLKTEGLKEIEDFRIKFKNYDVPSYDDMIESYNDLVSKLTPKMLYRD